MKKEKLLIWLPTVLLLVMALLTALVHRHFGQPWSGVMGFVTYGGMLLYVFLRRKRQQKDAQEQEEMMQEEVEEEEPFAAEVGGELPFLLVLHSLSGGIYQVFRSAKAYQFIKVGGELKGIDPEKMLEKCPTQTQLDEMKTKHFSIRKEDVQRFTLKMKHSASTNLPNSGAVTFYVPKKKSYLLLFDVTAQQAEHFFSDLRDRTEKKEKAYHRQQRRSDKNKSLGQWRKENQNPRTLKILKKVTMGLTIAGAALSLAFMFLPTPYKLNAWALLVLALVSILLPLIFPAYYSLIRTSEEAKKLEGSDCISGFGCMIASCIGLALRGLMDFNFLSEWWIFATGGALALVLTALFTIRLPELRRHVGWIFGILFMMTLFSMGIPAELNYLLDTSEPVVEEREVQRMYISTSSKGPDSYYCVVDLDGKEVKVDVGEEAYETIRVGDSVVVLIYDGAFGAQYCFIDTEN